MSWSLATRSMPPPVGHPLSRARTRSYPVARAVTTSSFTRYWRSSSLCWRQSSRWRSSAAPEGEIIGTTRPGPAGGGWCRFADVSEALLQPQHPTTLHLSDARGATPGGTACDDVLLHAAQAQVVDWTRMPHEGAARARARLQEQEARRVVRTLWLAAILSLNRATLVPRTLGELVTSLPEHERAQFAGYLDPAAIS